MKNDTELVRCLGHCNKKFLSPDKTRVRICPACKKINKTAGKEPVQQIRSNRRSNDSSN